MRRICLTLPTDRACTPMLHELAEEAAYGVSHFDVEVVMLVLDSSSPADFGDHARVLAALPPVPGIEVVHLNEDAQRVFFQQVIKDAGLAEPDRILTMMLPGLRSYGACTNRAFVIAAALGCDSVHRRDSDSSYQELAGAKIFPIHHELSIGTTAAAARDRVSTVDLAPGSDDLPVVMAGASFIGDMSVDIDDIRQRDPEIYYNVVTLWARGDASETEKRALVAESFTGAGTEPFRADESVLTLVDPMRVDMANIAFHRIHEQVPLPPATETIGSDYFLMHLVHDSGLPGVLHNRHIVNLHTGERKTEAGFASYQLALTKFFLSMLYLWPIYDDLAKAGSSLRDDQGDIKASMVSDIVRRSTQLPVDENVDRLDRLDEAYRQLGGQHAAFAESLVGRRDQLLTEARQDSEDFAVLIDVWQSLITASKEAGAGLLS
ncbi:hypothetical protein E1263_06935 [Kribbella antibiotica]|uniref:Glycosyltransferase family 2 protein n=1 Tax=Kribbella antibiotica TaxID=190195 RepID=A0A4R4ZRH2_9ACTN|nr:DUF6271 family protein [Kribbella antibiotica]TDD61618.1 hypothetical protein E1263_06935 [Kribbella antibiotica]